MKAVVVFLIGVAVGWTLLPRLDPDPIVELEPILPGPGIAWHWILPDGRLTTAHPWSRPQ